MWACFSSIVPLYSATLMIMMFHMLMNNDVNLNGVMTIWSELNVLMKKCNYLSKEQYRSRKINTMSIGGASSYGNLKLFSLVWPSCWRMCTTYILMR